MKDAAPARERDVARATMNDPVLARESDVALATMNDRALARVTVVLVSYNSAHCWPAQQPTLNQTPHVFIVDNASADDSVAQARQRLPHARVFSEPINRGFGAANNRALTEVQTEFVLLLNPDCVVDSRAIVALVDCADRFPAAAAVAPQLVDARGRLDGSYRMARSQWRSQGPLASATACVGFLSGACLLVRADAMRRVGGFDEAFFLYYEDDDLCLRLQTSAGALLIEPGVQAEHRSRGSVAGPQRYRAEYLRGFHHIQSKFRFAHKHGARLPSMARRTGIAGVALLETALRLLVLDGKRAARVWGRVRGVLAWRAPA